MEESRRNENKEGKESGKRVEMTRGMGEKKKKKQRNSDAGKDVFCMWRFWAHHLSL